MDYIFGGCKISVHIAIDFTASNGYFLEPESLHYYNPQSKSNEYADAIVAIL